MANVPANLTLSVFQGQTFNDEIIFMDGQTPPVPIDFTGKSARMQVRRAVPDDEVLLNLGTDAGTIVALGSDGKIVFNVTATVTSELPTDNVVQTWVYDLEVYDLDDVQRLMQGAFVVYPEVTRG